MVTLNSPRKRWTGSLLDARWVGGVSGEEWLTVVVVVVVVVVSKTLENG